MSLTLTLCAPSSVAAQESETTRRAAELCKPVDAKVLEWRRDFHRHPELSNREFRTARKIAAHLKGLGLQIQTNVAHTGVVALLNGNGPGPTLALRADMDALPVT